MTRVNGKSLARRAVARRQQSTDITGLAILQVHGFETSRSLKGKCTTYGRWIMIAEGNIWTYETGKMEDRECHIMSSSVSWTLYLMQSGRHWMDRVRGLGNRLINAQSILVGKPQGRRHIWEDHTEMDLREVSC